MRFLLLERGRNIHNQRTFENLKNWADIFIAWRDRREGLTRKTNFTIIPHQTNKKIDTGYQCGIFEMKHCMHNRFENENNGFGSDSYAKIQICSDIHCINWFKFKPFFYYVGKIRQISMQTCIFTSEFTASWCKFD